MDHSVVYVSSMTMCFVITAVLFSFNFKNWRSHFFNPLCGSYLLLMLSIACDIIWMLIDGKPQLIEFNYVINVTEYCSFGFMGYLWLHYCLDRFPFPFCHRKITKFIAILPAIAVAILTVTSCRTGWLFFLDSGAHYHRGPLFFFQQVGFLYLMAVPVLALISRSKVSLSSQKTQFTVMALFSLPAMVLGTLQLLMPPGGLPTMQFSVLLSLMIVYANEQDRRVTRDFLTKLMNRYEFERILDDRMDHRRRGSREPLFLLIGDLDNFKQINDTYGHIEGDRVLRAVAGVLEQVSQHHNAYVARMAGDEFLAMIEADDISGPESFRDEVSSGLARLTMGHPMTISMSMGIARYDGKMTLLEFFSAADHKLYEAKKTKPQYAIR